MPEYAVHWGFRDSGDYRIYNLFKDYDSNDDGRISRKEYDTRREFWKSYILVPEFDDIDNNQDGYIDLFEHADFWHYNDAYDPYHQLYFNEIDSDGDGLITEDEFDYFQSGDYNAFERADYNKDGYVDLDEHTDWWGYDSEDHFYNLYYFNDYDSNKDGLLTEDEFNSVGLINKDKFYG